MAQKRELVRCGGGMPSPPADWLQGRMKRSSGLEIYVQVEGSGGMGNLAVWPAGSLGRCPTQQGRDRLKD